jgi:ABC-type bacteriocin/lantibiotic exporter with double-glycine peptidase domain
MACGQRLPRQQGFDVFQSNLRRGFYKGLEPQALAENLNRFQPGWKGFYAYPTAEDIAGLATRGPYIARIGGNPGHFVVVESVENGLVKLWDPAGGVARSQALSDFVNIVSGVVFR